jgi:hypothetical protein
MKDLLDSAGMKRRHETRPKTLIIRSEQDILSSQSRVHKGQNISRQFASLSFGLV